MIQQSHILTSTVSTWRRQRGKPMRLRHDPAVRDSPSLGRSRTIARVDRWLRVNHLFVRGSVRKPYDSSIVSHRCYVGTTVQDVAREENALLPHVSVFILLRTLPMFSAFVSLFFLVVEDRVFNATDEACFFLSYDEFRLIGSIYWFTLSKCESSIPLFIFI